MFCKCVEVRSWRASRKALQILFTLEVLLPDLDIDGCSSTIPGLVILLIVSLYIVFDTSSSLRQSADVGRIKDRAT